MTLWDVHLTVRDSNGDRVKEFCGAHSDNELPAILEAAMRRAEEERGGLQIVRHVLAARTH
jgi:hypothetical protein